MKLLIFLVSGEGSLPALERAAYVLHAPMAVRKQLSFLLVPCLLPYPFLFSFFFLQGP